MKHIVTCIGVIIILAGCSQPEQSATPTTESEGQTEAQSKWTEPQANPGQITGAANIEPVQDKLEVSKLIETEMKTPLIEEGEEQLEKTVAKSVTTVKDSRPSRPVSSSSQEEESSSKKVISKPVQMSKKEPSKKTTEVTKTPVAKPSSPEVMAGNAKLGAALAMKKCKMCHYLDSARKKIGPSLQGIHNRAPSISGVPYAVWDDKALDEWLTKPKAVKPKTKMRFSGLKKKADRQDLIAYLKTL